MINQLFSLEIAVGIGAMLNRPILLHHVNDPRGFGRMFSPIRHVDLGRGHLMDNDHAPLIQDLVRWAAAGWEIVGEDLTQTRLAGLQPISLSGRHYVNCRPGFTPHEAEFNNYLTYLYLDRDENYNLVDVLSTYCRFFFNRSVEVDHALNQVQWRSEYTMLAANVAASLGQFVGAHLRLTDHAEIAFQVSEAGFEAGLQAIEQGQRVVLTTDDPHASMVRRRATRFILLDSYIVENFGEEFRQLPFHDEVVFGLICCLVMTYSTDFVGTPGSTFTAYIHRKLNQRGACHWRFFEGNAIVLPHIMHQTREHGRYSWTGYTQMPHWWREWPESKLVLSHPPPKKGG